MEAVEGTFTRNGEIKNSTFIRVNVCLDRDIWKQLKEQTEYRKISQFIRELLERELNEKEN